MPFLVPSYRETSYGSKFFQQNFSFGKIHASTKFSTVLSNGIILTVTVVFNEIPFILTVVFNEIPFILVHGVKVKE